MADKHAVNYDIRELKLGASFTNNKATQYHTIKYDFKPASVDVNKMATVDVGTNNQVTVTVPHLDGAGVPQTVFKGNQRPYTKECVLIIDKITGDITLEKLSSNIQLKKTRQECVSKPRPVTPALTDTTMRSSSRTRVATNRRTATPAAGNSGLSASAASRAPGLVRSPPRHRTEAPQAAPWTGGNSTLASLPMIGLLDEPAAPPPAPHPAPPPAPHSAPPPAPHTAPHAAAHLAPHAAPHAPPPAALQIPVAPAHPVRRPPEAASGSSSSSSSDSGSDSDSNSDDDAPKAANLPPDVLNDDLCLSSSDSD